MGFSQAEYIQFRSSDIVWRREAGKQIPNYILRCVATSAT